MDAHLTYTLPVVVALFLIARPFLSRSEFFKIAVISAFAVTGIIPWSNHLIDNEAVTYSSDRVLGLTRGRLPVDDYIFVIVQTAMTSLWTFLCVRWSYHACLHFNFNKHSYQLIRWIPIIIFGALTAFGYGMAVPGQNTFYLGTILYWSCPVIGFLWYGTGNYFVNKIISVSVAIVFPTLYLCRVDQIEFNNKFWHVNEQTSLNRFTIGSLPLEQVLFLFLSNTIIVLAASSFDKARGLMETYTLEFPERFSITRKYIRQLLVAFWTSEYSMPKEVTDDIKAVFDELGSISKTLSTSCLLLQSGFRLDMILVYGFIRITDNCIDGNFADSIKTKKIEAMEQFIDELFIDRKSDLEVKNKPYVPKINWEKYQSELTDLEMASFRSFSRIAFYYPRKIFDEVVEGFSSDVERKKMVTEKDLMHYTNLVAGSFGPCVAYAAIYRCDDSTYDVLADYSFLLEKSYQLGRSLQYLNIARDVVSDSVANGLVYVPTEYMDDEEEELRIMGKEKNARALGDEKLRKYISKLIRLSYIEYWESVDCIKYLPYEVRNSTLAAVEVYRKGHINAIQCTSPTAPQKPSPSEFDKLCIALHALYIKSIPYFFGL